jgi:hypothetical protein
VCVLSTNLTYDSSAQLISFDDTFKQVFTAIVSDGKLLDTYNHEKRKCSMDPAVRPHAFHPLGDDLIANATTMITRYDEIINILRTHSNHNLTKKDWKMELEKTREMVGLGKQLYQERIEKSLMSTSNTGVPEIEERFRKASVYSSESAIASKWAITARKQGKAIKKVVATVAYEKV